MPSRLDAPEIRAVLEANRAKIALLQQQQKQKKERELRGIEETTRQSKASDDAKEKIIGSSAQATSVRVKAAADPSPTEFRRQKLHSNPVYGDEDAAATPTAQTRSDGSYAPKLAGAIRSPPVAVISSGAPLPPLGDLFSPSPQLPLGIDIKTNSSSNRKVPGFALWDSERPYLSKSHVYRDASERMLGQTSSTATQKLESYPYEIQESLLVDDLLHAFDGLDGTWVRCQMVDGFEGRKLEYTIAAQGQLEPALLEIATRMLPLCEYVVVIQRYVETRRHYPWGLVCQALAGAMRGILQDWSLMLAQLEHQLRTGKLTLQALWYYVQPPMASLSLVASLVAEASSQRLRGAALLDMLHARASSLLGDTTAHKLAQRLLKAAAEPYFAVLERWICDGEVDDPYGEFLVREDQSIQTQDLTIDGTSAFWFDRWTLRLAVDPTTGSATGLAEVPMFLIQAKEAILSTGKYINLVRSCGKQLERTLPIGVHLTYDEGGRYLLHVHEAHRIAALSAMKHLKEYVGSYGHGLAVLKRYFLSAQGDLFLAVMDGGEIEFGRQSGQVELSQLQNVLDIAIRGSSAGRDPAAYLLKAAYDHRSMLNMLIAITSTSTSADASALASRDRRPKLQPVRPMPMTLSEKSSVGRQKRARESFMLSYEVPWPLSVVVPDAAMAHYQMIFRHIFELKWVERELNRVCAMYRSTAPVLNARRRATRRQSLIVNSAAAAVAECLERDLPAAVSVALVESYRTCQLMTHFFKQYLLYATFEVLEPLWNTLEHHIQASKTVDEVIEHHRVFLRKVMKGVLLSRKVVVLRALLSLKDLALSFVNLSTKFADIDYDALDAEAEAAGLLFPVVKVGSEGKQRERHATCRERHLVRQAQIRRAIDSNLSKPEFIKGVRELRDKFEARCGDFMSALKEAHRQAQSDRSDTREELESLLNLMSRLNFNGYFGPVAEMM